MSGPELHIHTIVSEPFQESTFVVSTQGRDDVLVIDPGLDPDRIVAYLRRNRFVVAAILITHAHADHIAGNAALKAEYPGAVLVIGERESALLSDPEANLSAPFGFPITSPPADRLVVEGDVLEYAGIRLDVLDVPGHSPGHVVYLHRGDPPLLFAGDVLFQRSIGRTDFPGSNGPLLLAGIRGKLFPLAAETVVYPGHGPLTTIGEERLLNPFLRE